MKLIDDRNDYFLHDFNAGESSPTDGGNACDESPSQGASNPSTSTFEFTPSGCQDNGGEKRRRRPHTTLIAVCVILALVLVTAFYIRYFVPYVTEAKVRGYVTQVEKRGVFFRTFEGDMITETQLVDTARVYSRDFTFSIPDDSIGRLIQSYQGTGRQVMLTTDRYYGTLPWRGASKVVVTDFRPL